MRTRIVILAAGRSTRMKSEIPKMLIKVEGESMVGRVVHAAVDSRVDSRPIVVVGSNALAVKEELGDRCEYVFQEQQLGTGHAVQCAEPVLRGKAEAVLVLYGDNCFIHPQTIAKLAATHEREGAILTMLTSTLSDFEDWRKIFFDFGRLIRDANGSIVRSVERKDATPEELSIREINPSFYCFDAAWLWKNLKNIKNENAQKEYYLTDLVQLAIAQGRKIVTISVPPEEVMGINTLEQLELSKKTAV